MSNVIDISEWRAGKRGSGPIDIPPAWLCDLRVVVGMNGYEGSFIERSDFHAHLPEGDQLRIYADALDQLSWLLRQIAEKETPGDTGLPIATATVFESSHVRVRVNDTMLETKEQEAWLDKRWDDAKEASRKPAVEPRL